MVKQQCYGFFKAAQPTKLSAPRKVSQDGVKLPTRTLVRLVGLVVKAFASRAEDPGFKSRLQRDFSGVESYQ